MAASISLILKEGRPALLEDEEDACVFKGCPRVSRATSGLGELDEVVLEFLLEVSPGKVCV